MKNIFNINPQVLFYRADGLRHETVVDTTRYGDELNERLEAEALRADGQVTLEISVDCNEDLQSTALLEIAFDNDVRDDDPIIFGDFETVSDAAAAREWLRGRIGNAYPTLTINLTDTLNVRHGDPFLPGNLEILSVRASCPEDVETKEVCAFVQVYLRVPIDADIKDARIDGLQDLQDAFLQVKLADGTAVEAQYLNHQTQEIIET